MTEQEVQERVSNLLGDQKLPERELAALRYFIATQIASLSAEVHEQLLRLYLCDKSTEQIRQAFPQYTLGQIVHAKVVGRWDVARVEVVEALRRRAVDDRVEVLAEVREFTSDLLVATVRDHHRGILLFLATEDPSHLKLRVDKPGDLKKVLDIYEQTHRGPNVLPVVDAPVGVSPSSPAPSPSQNRRSLAQAQAALLSLLTGGAVDAPAEE